MTSAGSPLLSLQESCRKPARIVLTIWKPDAIGTVVAEREFVARNSSGRASRVRVRFGQPVKVQGGTKRDPWWCPVETKGAGLDSFRPVAGLDSLQALILALDLVTRVLPTEAERAGLRIEWLGETERLVLARQAFARSTESAMLTLFGLLRDVGAILSSDRNSERQTTAALRAIVSSSRQKAPAPRKQRRAARKPG